MLFPNVSNESPFGRVAPRLCQLRREAGETDLEIPLDNNGFLDAAVAHTESAVELTPGALVDPKVVFGAGVLVLLGEPGVGKSTTFRSILGSDVDHVWVEGAELTLSTFDDLLGSHLRELPKRGGGTAPRGRFVVVIDQLDESQVVRAIASPLRRALAGRDVSDLRMLIGCRAADFPAPIADALKSANLEVHLADLAPLTRKQAEDLANSVPNVNGVELVGAAVEAGAGALASVPLTLSMLVRTYGKRGQLESNTTDLFADGVRRFADGPQDRLRGDFVSTTEQRVAVAGRIAAHLLLTARSTLWRGAVLQAEPFDLNMDSLVGGKEVLPNGSFVDVTKPILDETLGTALFTGRGNNRLGFRHSSIAAYFGGLASCEPRGAPPTA